MKKYTQSLGLRLGISTAAVSLACDEGLDSESELVADRQAEFDDVTIDALELNHKPKLWSPYPSGVAYRCTQGANGSFSHDFSNTKLGLDFDTPNDGSAKPVIAALAGTVGYVQTACTVGDGQCGGGFGNHVKLDHGGGYYTIYAHLSSVEVVTGEKVGRAQLLGYEGNTGRSVGDHLHFSLHQGNASIAQVAESVAYSVRNKDVTVGDELTDRSATHHICSLESGHFYESDNACSSVFDSLFTAKQITNNVTYLGETCAVGDIDYFYLVGKSGSFSSTVESTDESTFDCSCAILDSQGHELTQGGPEGYVRNDGFNGAEGCACSMANASAQKYYLKIYTHMPGAYWFSKKLS